jgi:hypothetical protein
MRQNPIMRAWSFAGDFRALSPRRLARDALRSPMLAEVGGALISRPLLRATIGRWPTRAETELFRAAFARRHDSIPPIVRALGSVPAARPQLGRAMLISWMTADAAYRGELARGLDSAAATGPGDVLSVWQGEKVAFLHLEKTAGMAVSQALEAQFHPTQINLDAHRLEPDATMRRYALIRGHFDLPTLRRIDQSRFVLTFLREPSARILSLYYYWRSYTPDLHHAISSGAALAASMGLLDWLRCEATEVRDSIDNHYVRRLLGDYCASAASDPLQDDPQGCLDRALAALDGLGFVGLTEAMDASLQALARRLGFTRPLVAQLVNVTDANAGASSATFRRVRREPITPEIRAELDRLTRLDRVLYERARARLEGLAPALEPALAEA